MNLLKFKNIVFQINLLTGELNSKLNTVEEKLNKQRSQPKHNTER